MKKKILKIVITVVIVAGLIALATWLSMPAEEYHLQLHRNVFDNYAFTDENAEIQLPFEVMIADFNPKKTATGSGIDTIYTISLLLQPMGNADANKITALDLHPLQTETYMHHDMYIEDFFYDEQEDRLIAFLKVERRRYQMIFNKLEFN